MSGSGLKLWDEKGHYIGGNSRLQENKIKCKNI